MKTSYAHLELLGFATDIAYRWRQNGDAPALVYLHGVGCSKDDFAAAYERPELADFSILSLDFPGCGESPGYPEDMRLGMNDLADITHSLTKKVDARRLALIGHSMGGAVMLKFARKYPESVAALISVEGNLTANESTFTKTIADMSKKNFANGGFGQLRARFAQSPNRGYQNYAGLLGSASAHVLHDYSGDLIKLSASGKLLETWQNTHVPRLYVYGQENAANFDHYRTDFAARDIQMAEIPHSNHWPMIDNPTDFYTTIGSFIRGIQGS